MSNTFQNNPAKRPAFSKFLDSQPGFVSKSLVEDFQSFETRYNEISQNREKYSPVAAREITKSVRENAQANPTQENVAAVAAATVQEVIARYEETSNELRVIQESLVARNKPLCLAIAKAALQVVGEHIEKVESEARDRFAKFGAVYDPSQDYLLLALVKYRDLAVSVFGEDRPAPRPDMVREWFGKLPTSKGLFA